MDVTWGDYTKASDKTTNKEGKEVDVSTYKRHPQKETVVIDLQEFSKNKEYPLVCDSNVILYVSKIGLKQGYTLITAYVNNKRKNPESDIAGMMFQVNLRAYSQDKMDIFVAEHICRKILAVDEFYFAQRPILGRGRGCAATWKANKNGRASEIVSTFIPEYEFPGVSAALEGFDPFFFSMRTLSVAKKKDDIINRLNVLANSYEDWIQKKLIHDSKMDDAKFKKEIGDTVINKCIEALGRIRAGIQLLVEDDTAFDAFCFMNRSMILQRNIMNFSKKHGAGIECAFSDIVQIDSRADVIIFSSSVVTAKMDLMQRFFGFEQYIRAGAQKTIEIIRDLDIVDSLEKFVAFENKSKLTNAKKLLKAKNSPVLQMKKNDLLENLKKHSRYKTMFKFEEDHIVISSQKEAAAFIKMLNDDIVRSELTGKEYDSSSKMLLGPVGASH